MAMNRLGLLILLIVSVCSCLQTGDEEVQTDCPKGKYGFECRYRCSELCKSEKCNISVRIGVPECNIGCNGYHTGIFCQELCPSLCLECNQTNGHCLKCTSGYYGANCTSECDSDCVDDTCGPDGACLITAAGERSKPKFRRSNDKCQRSADTGGGCVCCKAPYRGDKCDRSCAKCLTFYIPNKVCRYQCAAGFFGDDCTRPCPKNCAPGNSGMPLCRQTEGEMICSNGCLKGYTGQQCDVTCKGNCTDGTCHQEDGSCINCNYGYYGDYCTDKCSSGCEGGNCYRDGSCKEGCKKGLYGNTCTELCPANCLDCKLSKTFKCDGCKHSYFGALCTERCSRGCQDNVCKQNDGTCDIGCKNGFFGKKCHECGKYCEKGRCNEQFTDNNSVTYLCSDGCAKGYKGPQCETLCPQYCAICSQMVSEDDCSNCIDGYLLNNITCVPSTESKVTETGEGQREKTSILVGTATGMIIVVVGVIVVLGYKYRKRKRREITRSSNNDGVAFQVSNSTAVPFLNTNEERVPVETNRPIHNKFEMVDLRGNTNVSLGGNQQNTVRPSTREEATPIMKCTEVEETG